MAGNKRMDADLYTPMVVNMAIEVLDMQRELEQLRADKKELLKYRDMYVDLLNADIAHNNHMIGGMLELALKPGVMEAISLANVKV